MRGAFWGPEWSYRDGTRSSRGWLKEANERKKKKEERSGGGGRWDNQSSRIQRKYDHYQQDSEHKTNPKWKKSSRMWTWRGDDLSWSGWTDAGMTAHSFSWEAEERPSWSLSLLSTALQPIPRVTHHSSADSSFFGVFFSPFVCFFIWFHGQLLFWFPECTQLWCYFKCSLQHNAHECRDSTKTPLRFRSQPGLWKRSLVVLFYHNLSTASHSLSNTLAHTSTLTSYLVPLLRRGLLIGRRRCCLCCLLQVRDIGKVILLGHTYGQSQDHHLAFTGSPWKDMQSEIKTERRRGQRRGQRTEEPHIERTWCRRREDR